MASNNETLKFKGNPLKVSGSSLKVGEQAPKFNLVGNDLGEVNSDTFKDKVLVISVVPSLDTPTCSISTKKFNEEADKLDNVKVLTVSMDLPFAQKRWCGAEGVANVTTASDYKTRKFAEDYGVFLPDLGLTCRATFVVNKNNSLAFVDYVEELGDEPNYSGVLETVKSL